MLGRGFFFVASRCALSGVIVHFNLIGGFKLYIFEFPLLLEKKSKIPTNPTLPHKKSRKHGQNLED